MVEKIICFEYDYLQSRLVIIRFQKEALFTSSLTYKRWKVKKNLQLFTVHERYYKYSRFSINQ